MNAIARRYNTTALCNTAGTGTLRYCGSTLVASPQVGRRRGEDVAVLPVGKAGLRITPYGYTTIIICQLFGEFHHGNARRLITPYGYMTIIMSFLW